MDVMTREVTGRETQFVETDRVELGERLSRARRENGASQPLNGLYLNRVSVPLRPVYDVMEQSLVVLAQGSKETLLGDSPLRYDPCHYLLATRTWSSRQLARSSDIAGS